MCLFWDDAAHGWLETLTSSTPLPPPRFWPSASRYAPLVASVTVQRFDAGPGADADNPLGLAGTDVEVLFLAVEHDACAGRARPTGGALRSAR